MIRGCVGLFLSIQFLSSEIPRPSDVGLKRICSVDLWRYSDQRVDPVQQSVAHLNPPTLLDLLLAGKQPKFRDDLVSVLRCQHISHIFTLTSGNWKSQTKCRGSSRLSSVSPGRQVNNLWSKQAIKQGCPKCVSTKCAGPWILRWVSVLLSCSKNSQVNKLVGCPNLVKSCRSTNCCQLVVPILGQRQPRPLLLSKVHDDTQQHKVQENLERNHWQSKFLWPLTVSRISSKTHRQIPRPIFCIHL